MRNSQVEEVTRNDIIFMRFLYQQTKMATIPEKNSRTLKYLFQVYS